MIHSSAARISGRGLAVLILAVAAATIGAALVSEHVFGLVPCKLCLQQRWPYYLGVPLAAATALVPRGSVRRLGFAALAVIFVVSTGLGAYHAGVEWGWWAGPTDCGGGTGAAPPSVTDLAKSLETIRVADCATAAWRLLGISMAGWNALVSLGLAGLAVAGVVIRERTRPGRA